MSGPLMPGQIPGYESPVAEGVPPESPAGSQDVGAGPSPAGASPTEKLADGSSPSEPKVPVARLNEVLAQKKAAEDRNAELEATIARLSSRPETESFFSEEPQAPGVTPTSPAGTEEDPFGWLDERFRKAVQAELQPLKQKFAHQEAQQRMQVVEDQLKGLAQIVPDFDVARERAAMAEALQNRKKAGLDAVDAYLLANKPQILRMLAQRNAPQPAPKGGTGHDLGGAPVTSGPDSPDQLLNALEKAPPGIERDVLTQKYLAAFMQRQGISGF